MKFLFAYIQNRYLQILKLFWEIIRRGKGSYISLQIKHAGQVAKLSLVAALYTRLYRKELIGCADPK